MKYKLNDIAKALNVSPETVRLGLQLGIYPFGCAFKKPGKQHFTYVLYPEKVKEVIGEIEQ